MEQFRAAGNEGMRTSDTDAKFGQYTLPGGENYREKLYTLPEKKIESKTRSKLAKEMYGADSFYDLTPEQQNKIGGIVNEDYQRGLQNAPYRSPHWDEPNVLAHTRLNDRVDTEGNKLLHAEEIQSDWHQEGRKQGYQDPSAVSATPGDKDAARRGMPTVNPNPNAVPDAPFKKTWYELVLKTSARSCGRWIRQTVLDSWRRAGS